MILNGDCLEVMRGMESNSVDLVFASPPYEDCRSYGIGFDIRGQEFVDWCAVRFHECLRVSKGLVAWVIEGKTKDFRYTASPILLMADLHRAGVKLRKPPIFHRVGVFGGGGKDWLRNDYEFIICATTDGKLPWSNNTACGLPPKYKAGGNPSHRTKSGKVVSKPYKPPAIANPGNVLSYPVGGGKMGHDLAHENEAPFPLGLAEFFVKSFCPPGGIVLDPFGGSGTTAHAAKLHGRESISIDIRQSQCELTERRLTSVTEALAV